MYSIICTLKWDDNYFVPESRLPTTIQTDSTKSPNTIIIPFSVSKLVRYTPVSR